MAFPSFVSHEHAKDTSISSNILLFSFHRKENLAIFNFELKEDDMNAINMLKYAAKGFMHMDVRNID